MISKIFGIKKIHIAIFIDMKYHVVKPYTTVSSTVSNFTSAGFCAPVELIELETHCLMLVEYNKMIFVCEYRLSAILQHVWKISEDLCVCCILSNILRSTSYYIDVFSMLSCHRDSEFLIHSVLYLLPVF